MGHDLTTVHLILAKHKALESSLEPLERQLNILTQQGQELADEQIPGYEQIDPRIQQVQERWDQLKQLTHLRRQRLHGATDYYQVLEKNS